MPPFRSAAILLLVASSPLASSGIAAQTKASPVTEAPAPNTTRPLPGAVYETTEFSEAVRRGTRTRRGAPGAAYWVNRARYSINVQLDVATSTVSGGETVVYSNESPDTLREIAVHLRQNAFVAGNARVQSAPVTNGIELSRVAVRGKEILPSAGSGAAAEPALRGGRPPEGYIINGTVMWIVLAAPLLPHDSIALEFNWQYEPPLAPSDGRQGREDHLYFMGYWYPQIAVYDDVGGWVADQYLLGAEFYMDQADYDVRAVVPRGWVVGGTGRLVNAAEVLSPIVRSRLAEARRTGGVVHVVQPGEAPGAAAAGAARPGTTGGTATWHFVANGVRDFAWGTSDRYAWDATRALVQVPNGGRDTVDIYSFYRVSRPAAAWALGGARYTRDAIEQLSSYLWPYPWPVMTSMEGVLDGGGMEYPMLTLMQPWADTLSLAGDLMHETGHMWFPMQVGSNETRYTWMDEGFTQFDVAQAMRPIYGARRSGGRPGDSEAGQRDVYLRAARAGRDMPLMWHGDLYPPNLYWVMFYNKTAQVIAALRGVIGEEVFHRAWREYGARWNGKHPYPYDFFNTVNDVSGRDLSWFWQSWFYQPWPLDRAVASVVTAGNWTTITIEDRGLAPMPVRLSVTRADGSTRRIDMPADVWLTGARQQTVRLPARPRITRVEIDPEELFPDMNRKNELWENKR